MTPKPPVPLTQNWLVECLEALRENLQGRLVSQDGRRVIVGGWELQPQRDPILAIFAHDGDFEYKAGFQFMEKDNLRVILHYRSAVCPTDKEIFPLRDALMGLLSRFSHPHLAGIKISGWDFNYETETKNQIPSFDNILTLTGSITIRSNPHAPSEEENLFTVNRILFSVEQKEE